MKLMEMYILQSKNFPIMESFQEIFMSLCFRRQLEMRPIPGNAIPGTLLFGRLPKKEEI